jgi:hypothetical protein
MHNIILWVIQVDIKKKLVYFGELQWNDEPRQPILVIHSCLCGWTQWQMVPILLNL